VASVALGVLIGVTDPTGLVDDGDLGGGPPVTTIAILPFHNMAGSPELEWMENGLPEMITTDISQLRTLRPVLTDRIRSILQELARENDTRLDEQSIQMVCEMSRADYALSGQFIVSEGRLRIDLTLKNATHGLDAAIKVDGTSSAVFSLVDEITTKLSDVLEIDSRGEADRPLTELSTSSIDAFRAYNQGLQELQSGSNQTAISSFEEATRVDPNFAMAHARLAEALFNVGNDDAARQSIRQARAAAQKNPLPLVEGYQLHAIASRIEDDPDAAVTSYRELARMYPGDPGVQLSLATALENLGKVEEATELYRRVLEQAPQYGAAMLGMGRMLVLAGQNDEAVSVLEKALESGRFEADPETMGMIHSILGVAQRDLGHPKLAIDHQEKSLEFRRRAGDERGITATLTNLSILYIDNGDFASASRLLDEGLSRARSSANVTMESFALINLALLNERAGDTNRALEVASESMEIEWERKEHTELAGRLDFIGRLYASMGRYADAMVYLEQAKVHIAVSEEPRERGNNELHRGNVLFAKGSFEDALGALLKSVASYREAKDREGAGWALNSLARLYVSQGRLRDARAAIDQSKELCKQLGNPRLAATTQLNDARLWVRLGDFAGSDAALQQAEEILSTMKSHDLHGLFHLVAGEAATAQGEFGNALRHLEASTRAQDKDSLLVGLESRVRRGDTQLRLGDRKNALTSLEASWSDSLRLRLPVIQADAALALAQVHFETGNLDLAREKLDESIRLAEGFGGMPLLQEGYRLSALIENKAGRTKEAALALTRVSEIDLWLRDQAPDAVPSGSRL
jgi:tetratricopeptide (TPR) repeat protein